MPNRVKYLSRQVLERKCELPRPTAQLCAALDNFRRQIGSWRTVGLSLKSVTTYSMNCLLFAICIRPAGLCYFAPLQDFCFVVLKIIFFNLKGFLTFLIFNLHFVNVLPTYKIQNAVSRSFFAINLNCSILFNFRHVHVCKMPCASQKETNKTHERSGKEKSVIHICL